MPSALGLLGPGECRFAWGGSMAIRKETFFDIRVPDYWKNTVSDDYALAAAVARARSRNRLRARRPGALFRPHHRAPVLRLDRAAR